VGLKVWARSPSEAAEAAANKHFTQLQAKELEPYIMVTHDITADIFWNVYILPRVKISYHVEGCTEV